MAEYIKWAAVVLIGLILSLVIGRQSRDMSLLLTLAGIGLLSELASLICADAGEGAMGRALQILSNAAILWLSLPLFQQILTMIEGVLAQQ